MIFHKKALLFILHSANNIFSQRALSAVKGGDATATVERHASVPKDGSL